jgi:hypothetical protein
MSMNEPREISRYEFWIDYSKLDSKGQPMIYLQKPPDEGGFFGIGAQPSKAVHITRVTYENGEIYDFTDDGKATYVETDPQLATNYRWKFGQEQEEGATSPEVRQGPDGNWYQWNGTQWVPAPGMPTEQTDATRRYREFGGNLYVEDPTAPNGLRLVMEGAAATDPLDLQYKQLQIQRMQQDLQGPLAQGFADEEAAIRAIQQRLAAGQMTRQEADQMMAAIRARTQAGLQGTTPYQMQTDRQNLARGLLNDRMSNASGLAQGLFSGLGGVYGNILAGTGAPLLDPFAMARQYTDEMGGGQRMSELARAVLMGALQDGQRPPSGAGYLMPQRTMPGAPQGQSVEQWRPLVQKYFPAEAVENALKIMALESRGIPTAHNPGTNETPEDSWGLFQINARAHPQWAGLNLTDPETNIRLAAELFTAAGYNPWYNAAAKLGLLGGGP